VFSGVVLMLLLASPLVIRLCLSLVYNKGIALILGSVFIVLFAALLGALSKGKKLFEVLFFMITYVNINRVLVFNYFGGFKHHPFYVLKLTVISVVLGSICAFVRKYQLKN
jgi:hypothetical protein